MDAGAGGRKFCLRTRSLGRLDRRAGVRGVTEREVVAPPAGVRAAFSPVPSDAPGRASGRGRAAPHGAPNAGSRVAAMAEIQRWEYLTAPILVHAAKQILDNFGADGWEPCRSPPGWTRRTWSATSSARWPGDERSRGPVAELGLAVPEVAKPVASYVPAVRTGSYVYTSGQVPCATANRSPPARWVGRSRPRTPRRARSSAP